MLMPKYFLRFHTDQLPLLVGGVGASEVGGGREVKGGEGGGTKSASQILVEFRCLDNGKICSKFTL